MKNFNKDNSMKKFKCVLGMAALALSMVSNAIAAQPTLPTVPNDARIITVTSVSEWEGIQEKINQLSASEKNLVIRVKGNIKFSNNIGMPWSGVPANLRGSIDFGKRNVYVVGDKSSSSNSLSGILLKGAGVSLFKNVDTVYIENVDFKNCYLLAKSDDSHNSAAFLADNPKGVYLNEVTLENVGVKGVPGSDGKQPVFSTVGFLADTSSCNGSSCGSFIFQNASVDGLTIDSLLSIRTGGFFGYASGSGLIMSSRLKNISVGFSTDSPSWTSTTIYLGGVVAAVSSVSSLYMINSSLELAPLKFEAVDFSKHFVHIGGFAAEVEAGTIELEWSTISGNIDVVNNFDTVMDEKPMTLRVGSVLGYWMPKSSTPVLKLHMNGCVSTVNISVNLDAPHVNTASNTEALDFAYLSAAGGFFGSMAPGVNVVSGSIEGSSYSGSIVYRSKDESLPSIGGFMGVWGNGPITFSDNVVSGSAISYWGPYANIGALVGAVKNSKDSVYVNKLKVEKGIEASLSPVEGASIGGVFGIVNSSPVVLNEVSIKSDIAVNDIESFDPALTRSIDLSMGGAIGCIGNSKSDLKMRTVSYEGNLTAQRYYADDNKEQYVGGLVGRLKNTKNVSIEKASVVGKDGSLMSVKFDGGASSDRFEPIYMGGLIGNSPFETEGGRPSLTISESFVSGDIVVSDMKNSDTSYISGLVGHYGVADNVEIFDSYYNGGLTIDMKVPSPNKVSGLMTLSVDANDFSVKNSYVYDAKASASSLVIGQTDLSAANTYMFSSLDESIEGYTVGFSSPAFAYLLNEGEKTPRWGFDANGNDGLPQLVFSLGNKVEPIKRVILRGFDESGASPEDVEIYTDAEGKWELKADGKRFDSDELDVASYDAKSKKFVLWKQKNGDLVWNGLEKTASALVDGMEFEKQVVGVPKVVFDVDTTLETGNHVLFWDNSEYDIVKDENLPEAVFVVLDNNSNGTFYKGSFWKIAGTSDIVTSSAELINYVSQNPTSEVTLQFATDLLYDYVVAQPRGRTLNERESALLEMLKQDEIETTSLMLSNSSGIKIRYTCMGHERIVVFKGNDRLLPKVDKFSIVDVLSADSSKISFVVSKTGGVVVRADYLFGEELDLSSILASGEELMIYQTERTIRIPTGPGSTIVVDSTGKPSIVTVDSSGNTIIVPIGPTDDEPSDSVDDFGCADSVIISDAGVLKSGTAALFSFKLDAPSFCDTILKPHVIVSAANGFMKDSAFAFSRKTREFVFYPLDPGEYSFKVQASSKKSKSVKQKFSADIELRGRVWNMVAYGSWPKNALKNAKPTIYSWNESNAIGDYWQYEALPKNSKAVEAAGYWVRTESNVKFSLDLPLKKAESDSLKWTVDKKFSGWNMLANPYSWNLYAGSIAGFKSAENGDTPLWRRNTVTAQYEVADTLFAGEAFWINVDKKRTIRISTKPVFPSVKTKSAAKKSALLKSATKDSWSMVLVASTEDGFVDSWNVLGVGSNNIAIAEPPAGMESSVGVSFVGEDNALLAKRILAKASANEYSWKVQLNASKNGKVNLALEGLDEVRAMGYDVALVMDGKTYEWNDNSSMDVNVSGSKTAELKVVPAGTKIAAVKGIGNVHFDAVAGGIAVQFDVSAGMAGQKASVRLLDVNGNVVSTVYGNARFGTNDFRLATPARSGVYVLQVRVGHESRVARLSL